MGVMDPVERVFGAAPLVAPRVRFSFGISVQLSFNKPDHIQPRRRVNHILQEAFGDDLW